MIAKAFLTSDDNALFNLGLNRGMAVLVSQALYLEVSGGDGSELAVKEDGVNYWRGMQPERIQKVERIFKLSSYPDGAKRTDQKEGK